uniref:Uncharacterized protein n=1 Tax=Arundo donax TaxID=35708 RepID=A0A0A9DPT6_ARUDO
MQLCKHEPNLLYTQRKYAGDGWIEGIGPERESVQRRTNKQTREFRERRRE